MPQITEGPLDDLFIVYAAIFAVAVFFGWLYKRRIRMMHRDAWRGLGSPSFLNNSISNGFRSTGFLLRKKYEGLNDPTLNFYGRGARYGFIAILSFIALFFVLILIGQWQSGLWNKPVVVHTSYHPLNAVGALMLAIFGGVTIIGYLFHRRLKMQHPEVWNELGQPSLLNSTIKNGWKVAKFATSNGYKKLNDPTLTAYIWIGRALALAFLALYLSIAAGLLRT